MSEAANPIVQNISEDPNDDVLVVSTYEQESIPVVKAEGDVDLLTTPLLRDALDKACSGRKEPGIVAVDIREVPFIDSAGLALLVEIRKRYYDTCRLALIIAKGSQPERVLRLGRFDTFLQVCYSPEELDSSAAPAVSTK